MHDYSFERIIGKKENIKIFDVTVLRGKNVLVAGIGSIGSELVRILSEMPLKMLYLVDFNEACLSAIRDELDAKGFKNYKTFLVDLKVEEVTQQFFDLQIDYVINAAAYKHVLFCEENPEIAKENNLGVCRNLLAIPAEKQLFISTDKAVYPSCVMGRTKRVGELYYLEEDNGYVVRFGNVYGSSGSLLPRVLMGIEKGRVVITDKRAKRFFMTIREACYLVLNSLLFSNKRVNVLDMGEQVLIHDVLTRIIEESGKTIQIQEIGLQQGEKLSEELHYKDKIPYETFLERLSDINDEETVFTNFNYDISD